MKTPTSVHTACRGEVKEIGWLSAVCVVAFLIFDVLIPALGWVHHQFQAISPWLEPALAIALLSIAGWIGWAWWAYRNPPTAAPSLDQPMASTVPAQMARAETEAQAAPSSQSAPQSEAAATKPKWRTASVLDIYEG